MGEAEVVAALLEAGAEIDRAKRDGGTALHVGAAKGHLAVVATLLARGASLHGEMTSGATALHLAAARGRLTIILALLAAGANPTRTDGSGRTALDLVRASGNCTLEIVDALRSAKAASAIGTSILSLADRFEVVRTTSSPRASDHVVLPGEEALGEPRGAAADVMATLGSASPPAVVAGGAEEAEQLLRLRSENAEQRHSIAQLHEVVSVLHDQTSGMSALEARAKAAEARASAAEEELVKMRQDFARQVLKCLFLCSFVQQP
jgi:hypothetical protein